VTGTALPHAPQYDDAVDLGRYPINDPASLAYQDLVQTCRDQLGSVGVARASSGSCAAARMVSSGCPPAPVRSRSSAASTPCTGSLR